MRISPLLLLALVVACTNANTSTQGQMITCGTDPGTGVILRCEPGTGSGSGSGSGTQCHDVDEDGDGEPHDEGEDGGHDSSSTSSLTADDHGGSGSGSDVDDDDHDGIKNEDDCDNHPGEDDNRSAELPYDVRPALGATTRPIIDAFASEGAQPAEIVAVTMDGGSWRLTELQAGTAFVVTQDDCTHAGNRDVGRDRVFVTWRDASGATATDHLDIRYCNQ